MQDNFGDIFPPILDRIFEKPKGIKTNIEDILDEIVPLIIFKEKTTKSDLIRFYVRNKITTSFNAKDIYSCREGDEKQGFFIPLEKANSEQLGIMLEKAKKDLAGIEKRKKEINRKIGQISMRLSEEGEFLGLDIPEAVNL